MTDPAMQELAEQIEYVLNSNDGLLAHEGGAKEMVTEIMMVAEPYYVEDSATMRINERRKDLESYIVDNTPCKHCEKGWCCIEEECIALRKWHEVLA